MYTMLEAMVLVVMDNLGMMHFIARSAGRSIDKKSEEGGEKLEGKSLEIVERFRDKTLNGGERKHVITIVI